MEKSNFNILYESILNDINASTKDEVEKKYKSFDEFKHFCKELDLIVKLNELQEIKNLIGCSLFLINEYDGQNKPKRFDFLNQCEPEYIKKYFNLFKTLNKYKQENIVTLNGKENSPIIVWG
jgi:hypothetical protein